MQDEIDGKVVALAVNTTRFTSRTLLCMIQGYLKYAKTKQPKIYKGKQSIRRLMGQNAALSSLEVTDENIGSFECAARKYGIDYAVKKEKEQSRYTVFFKGKDVDVITMAFNEYVKKQLARDNKPSVKSELKRIKNLVEKTKAPDNSREADEKVR